jgi:hypothetical protein
MDSRIAKLIAHYEDSDFENGRLDAEELLKTELPAAQWEEMKASVCGALDLKIKTRPCARSRCESPEAIWNCGKWSAVLSRILPDPREISRRGLLGVFFYALCSSCEVWEDSYEYDHVACGLGASSCVCRFAADTGAALQWKSFWDSLDLLTRSMYHMVFIENGMIASDPTAMEWHCLKYLETAETTIGKLREIETGARGVADSDPMLAEVAHELLLAEEPRLRHHECLREAARLMKIRQQAPSDFKGEYTGNRKILQGDVETLEAGGDYEGASEMRAHVACLDRFLEHSGEPPLILEKVKGALMIGFCHRFVRSRGEDGKGIDWFKRIKEMIGKQGNIGGYEVTLSSDPLPDILDTAIGAKHFKNVMIKFPAVRVEKLPGPPVEPGDPLHSLELTPKLLHYALGGVGTLNFELSIPELSVSQFQTVKNLICEHSALYRISMEQTDSRPLQVWGRLNECAEFLIKEYSKFLVEVCRPSQDTGAVGGKADGPEQESGLEAEPGSGDDRAAEQGVVTKEQDWFANLRIYRIKDAEGRTFSWNKVWNHHEGPGVLAYHRADRATVDDWVGISLPDLGLENLAQIRAHKGDTFVISQNHAVAYLPDDPEFVVMQYAETAKWAFLIRTVLLHCRNRTRTALDNLEATISEVHSVLTERLRPGDDELEAKETLIYDRNLEAHHDAILAMSAIEHMESACVSPYSDHGMLLRRAFEAMRMPEVGRTLEKRVGDLVAGQETTATLVQRIQETREKKKMDLMNNILLVIAILQSIQIIQIVVKIAKGEADAGDQWSLFIVAAVTLVAVLYLRASSATRSKFQRTAMRLSRAIWHTIRMGRKKKAPKG